MKTSGQARQSHRILVCTSCKGKTPGSQPGQALIKQLRAALASDCQDGATSGIGAEAGEGFEVAGVACMAGCGSPCTVSFQAEDKAFYLFGKLDPARDVASLVAFARLYRERADGWSNSTERPDALRSKTLARIPAITALREKKDEPVFLTAVNS